MHEGHLFGAAIIVGILGFFGLLGSVSYMTHTEDMACIEKTGHKCETK